MPNTTTCSICRRPVPVQSDGAIEMHRRIHAGHLERCPGGK